MIGTLLSTPKQQAMDLQLWNDEHPVGTRIVYYPELPAVDPGRIVRTKVAARAFLLAGEAVVVLEGVAGFISLRHVHCDSSPESSAS